MLALILGLGIIQYAQGQQPKPGEGIQVPTVLRDPDRVIQATISIHIGLANEGSGVVVGQDEGKILVLSASHLFRTQTKDIEVSFFPPNPTKEDKILKDVVRLKQWPDIDLALLAVDPPRVAPLPLQLAAARSRPGKFRGTTHTAGCDKGFPTLRSELLIGKVLTTKNAGETEAFYWEMQDPSIPGRSGGPLVDVDGRLLGICSGTDKKGRGMYVHIDEIRAALKEAGLLKKVGDQDRLVIPPPSPMTKP